MKPPSPASLARARPAARARSRRSARRLPAAPTAIAVVLGLACASGSTSAEPEGRAGEPPPPATAPAADPAATAFDGAAPANTSVSGRIPGLEVRVTSTYAYRDWMPRMGGPRGEDGGSPLHLAIGLTLENHGERALVLDRSARLGATGTPLRAVALDDLASATPWPLTLAPGESRPLQLGTRDGPFFPLGEALDLEIDLSAEDGGRVRIAIDDLPIGRTD